MPNSTTKKDPEDRNGSLRSLARGAFLVIVVVSITPMILVSIAILYQFQHSYEEKVHAHLETLVKKHKRAIDTFLETRLGDIRFLTKTFSVGELASESFLRDTLETLQTSHGPVFVDLGVVNERGLQIAYAGPFKLGKALYFDADWFRKAMKQDFFVSDVFLGLRGLPHFIIAVKANWMGHTYIIRATIDFVAFNDLVEQVHIGETGFAYILNGEGRFQTKPLTDVSPAGEPCREWLAGQGRFDREICITEELDREGIKYLYVGASLKNGDWLLMFRQRHSDAFYQYRKAIKVTLAILVLGGLGILSMAYLLSRRMVGKIAQVDQEKQLMNEQIVETGKLASVGELAAGIAHEINNPVAIMVEEAGWIEDLLEEDDLKESKSLEEFQRALKQIETQGRRCKEITHKLLSFARKTDSRVKEVDLNELIEEIVALSAQRARYSNVSVNMNLGKDIPPLQAAQTELQQVFLNLINNALDAMEKNGGSIDITTALAGDRVVVTLADTGPGIPAANLGRIFDPFYTTKPVGKGTGLGLAICYGIIKKMGGDIEVRSVVDRGTTFRITIPTHKEPLPREGEWQKGGGTPSETWNSDVNSDKASKTGS